VALPPRSEDDRLFGLLRDRRTSHGPAGGPVPAAALATLLGWGCGRSRTVAAYGDPAHPLSIAPMPGGIDALRSWVVVQDVAGVSPGLYAYEPGAHRRRRAGRPGAAGALLATATQHELLASRGAVVVLAVDPADGVRKYGPQFSANAALGVGGALQTLHLTATALGLQGGSFTGVDRPAAAVALGTAHDVLALFAVSTRPDRPGPRPER
jgi:hypothetical protein